MQTFSQVFPVTTPDQDELDAAQTAYDIINYQIDVIDGDIQKLRSELGKISQDKPAEPLPDAGKAFVDGLLSESPEAAQKAADDSYRAEQKRRDTALLADEKTRSIISALGSEINRQETKRAEAVQRAEAAGLRLGRIKGKFVYHETVRPAARALLEGMQALQRLEEEFSTAGCQMSFYKWRLINPINDDWLDLSAVLEDE